MVLNLEYYDSTREHQHKAIMESSVEDSVNQCMKKYDKIKNSDDPNTIKSWMKYALQITIPSIAVAAAGGEGLAIVIAAFMALLGRPGTKIRNKNYLLMLENEINECIDKVERDKKATDKQKLQAVSQLKKLKYNVHMELHALGCL
jgi:hypothetical protein